jgi:hypothetical protein
MENPILLATNVLRGCCPGYKQIMEIERAFRDLKSALSLRPVTTTSPTASAPLLCSAYVSLTTEIKLGHYSPKTLKAYTGWVRQFFQTYHQKGIREDKEKEIAQELKEHLEKVIKLHREDLEWEYAGQIKILTSQKYT